MKKRFFLSICTLLVVLTSIGQNAFYDAQFINTLDLVSIQTIIDSQTNKFIKLSEEEEKQLLNLKKFIINPYDSSIDNFDIEYAKSAIKKYNTFVTNSLNAELFSPINGISGFNSSGFTGSSLFSILPDALSGNFALNADTQTKLLDGLVKYIAEEFKKAQLLTYMQTFEATIGEVGELEILLPGTFEKLKKLDPTKFPELGNEFKEIFNDDLSAILENLDLLHLE
ncbi:MAG: hypothetical protein GKR88_01695 [Flavobacteriaceae bacterium]|nr:MAG: hypothetical protein GKR88_01695 [Flavobacteriaceae bacterium]